MKEGKWSEVLITCTHSLSLSTYCHYLKKSVFLPHLRKLQSELSDFLEFECFFRAAEHRAIFFFKGCQFNSPKRHPGPFNPGPWIMIHSVMTRWQGLNTKHQPSLEHFPLSLNGHLKRMLVCSGRPPQGPSATLQRSKVNTLPEMQP